MNGLLRSGRARRRLRWLLVCVGAGTIVGTAIRLGVRESELRAQERHVAAALEANREQIRALREAERRAEHAMRATSAKPAAAKSASKDPAVEGNLADGSRIFRRVRSMAEYAPHECREHRRHIVQQYGELFAELALPPDRLEAFKRLLAENWGITQDAFNACYEQGWGQSSPEFQQVMKRYYDEAEARIRDFLGPDNFERYQDYNKSYYWRTGQRAELESYLSLRGLPALTGEQKSALSAAYVEAQNWKPEGDAPPHGVLFRLRNQRLGELAAKVLDPEQHAATVAYLRFVNERTQLLGRLLHPQDPDGVVISVGQ